MSSNITLPGAVNPLTVVSGSLSGSTGFLARSWRRLFSSGDSFFVLLTSLAEEGRENARAVAELMKGGAVQQPLRRLDESRVRQREIAGRIEEMLCLPGPVPFGRDDIEPLARAVRAVPRSIRTFGERYCISVAHVTPAAFVRQAAMLGTATDTVHSLVMELRGSKRISEAKRFNDTLQQIEGDMDKAIVESIMALYDETRQPVRAVVEKDLHELLERTFDCCRTAGNLMLRIAMKHS